MRDPIRGSSEPGRDDAGSRAERAYCHIKTSILSAKLTPGAVLHEQDIAEFLGISRTPVREALRKLEQERLVTRLPHRGALVAHLSFKDVMDLWQIREILEPVACRLAATRVDPIRLATIEKMMLELEHRPGRLEDYENHHHADVVLHRLIHEATGNAALAQILETINGRIARVRMINASDRLHASVAEHLQIIAALRAGDPDAATEAMRTHLMNARRELVRIAPPGDPTVSESTDGRAHSGNARGRRGRPAVS